MNRNSTLFHKDRWMISASYRVWRALFMMMMSIQEIKGKVNLDFSLSTGL